MAISAHRRCWIRAFCPWYSPRYRDKVLLLGSLTRLLWQNRYPFGEQNLQTVHNRMDISDHLGVFFEKFLIMSVKKIALSSPLSALLNILLTICTLFLFLFFSCSRSWSLETHFKYFCCVRFNFWVRTLQWYRRFSISSDGTKSTWTNFELISYFWEWSGSGTISWVPKTFLKTTIIIDKSKKTGLTDIRGTAFLFKRQIWLLLVK